MKRYAVKIKCKAKYAIEGEKCNKFFFQLEKVRQKKAVISNVIIKDGTKVKTTNKI